MNTENLKIVQDFFAGNQDCEQILCEFNGEGDSGSIENTEALGCDAPQAVLSAAEDLAYEALEKQGLDWYNNGGGFGEVTIFRDGRIRCDTNTRRIESNQTITTYQIFAEKEEV